MRWSYLDFYYDCKYRVGDKEITRTVLNIHDLYEYLDTRGIERPVTFPANTNLEPPCIHGGVPTKEQVDAYAALGANLDRKSKMATTYVDTFANRFAGVKATPTQHLEWPRIGAFYYDEYQLEWPWIGNEYVGVPDRIKYATAQTMVRLLNDQNPYGDWFTSYVDDTASNLVREKFGDIEFQYTANTSATEIEEGNINLEMFLQPLFVSNKLRLSRTY